jgi:hypothetical protein
MLPSGIFSDVDYDSIQKVNDFSEVCVHVHVCVCVWSAFRQGAEVWFHE